ncbi:MAG: PEP-CTERM sorting domain-containing protein [Planctomycetia bacterium]|nr:PEP-CTERM sorting domain-containing protein [Planctomycetia bacterium]
MSNIIGKVQAVIIAQTGFNDAMGINSNATPNSPYQLSPVDFGASSVHGHGIGEPGWGGFHAYWIVGGSVFTATAQSDVTYEGDGAMWVRNSSNPQRSFPEQSSGQLVVEQYVRMAVAVSPATLMFNLNNDPNTASGNTILPAQPSLVGPEWFADSDHHFKIVDGVGDGSLNHVVDTGLMWMPDQWHRIDMLIDISSRTWQFSVDGVQFSSPHPIGFVGSIASLAALEYIGTFGGAYVDALSLASIPEPSSIVLAALGLLGLAAWGWRRRKCA